jgi:hypothetical protein
VSHSPIGPYCASAAARSLHQSSIAARSVSFVHLVVGAATGAAAALPHQDQSHACVRQKTVYTLGKNGM